MLELFTTYYIVIAVLSILIIGLVIGIRNLNIQNEQYQDYIEEELVKTEQLRIKVEKAYDRMQDADIRGSFESDDEVGSAFSELKEIIEELNKTI